MADGAVRCIDSEIPFAIPDSWTWCRMQDVLTFINGRAYKKEELLSKGKYKVLRVGNFFTNNQWYYSDLELPEDKYCNKGDLLYAWSASFGPQIWEGDKTIFHYHIWNVKFDSRVLCREYLYYFFLYDKMQVKSSTTGSTMIHVSMKNMKPRLIPVPPIKEQIRVTDVILQLLPLAKRYDLYNIQKETLNNGLNENLKNSILQEAIQGRLVPQIESEGTAEQLLAEIAEEKKWLVKEGKLKKSARAASRIFRGDDNRYYEQIASDIEEIEVGFNHPSSWSVCRLRDLCQLTDGEKTSGSHPCLDAKYLRGKSSGTLLTKGKLVHYGDNIILVDGENSGEVFFVPCDGYMGSTFKQLWISKQVDRDFVLLIILFYKSMLRNSKKGAAIPHLNKELFYNIIVGLPPLSEQQRIVRECNLLFDTLK